MANFAQNSLKVCMGYDFQTEGHRDMVKGSNEKSFCEDMPFESFKQICLASGGELASIVKTSRTINDILFRNTCKSTITIV